MSAQIPQEHIEAKKRVYWSNVISDWEKSGLTKYQFCKLKKINHSTFYTWNKKLKIQKPHRDLASQKGSNPLKSKAPAKKPAFIPIDTKLSKTKSTVKSALSELSIALPNGIEIKIVSPSTMSLVDCVKALKEV